MVEREGREWARPRAGRHAQCLVELDHQHFGHFFSYLPFFFSLCLSFLHSFLGVQFLVPRSKTRVASDKGQFLQCANRSRHNIVLSSTCETLFDWAPLCGRRAGQGKLLTSTACPRPRASVRCLTFALCLGHTPGTRPQAGRKGMVSSQPSRTTPTFDTSYDMPRRLNPQRPHLQLHLRRTQQVRVSLLAGAALFGSSTAASPSSAYLWSWSAAPS